MIAPITETTPCQRDPIPGRKKLDGYLLRFDRFAAIDVANVWPGYRSPFIYSDDIEVQLRLPVALEHLHWTPR